MRKTLLLILITLATLCTLVSCSDSESLVEVNADGYVVVNGVATNIIADKEDVIFVDDNGYVVVNGVKTEHKIHTRDEISINADGYVVVNGVTTNIVADKEDVISVDDNGYVVVNGVKTDIIANWNDPYSASDGLFFVTTTINGVVGMIVDEYKGCDTEVIIPSYVGSIPVVGINCNAFINNTQIVSVKFSKNLVWLEEYVFFGCSNLETIDFNGATLTEIPDYAFFKTKITQDELPDSVLSIGENCFGENEWYFIDDSFSPTT